MTDEDLEKRLRSNNSASYASVAISYEAADAIERLRARAEKAEAVRDAIGRQLVVVTAAHEKAEREQDEAIARAKTSAVLAATETGKLMKVIAGADELERETIERCAKVAEEWGIDSAGFGSVPADPFAAMRMAGESIAAAIRAMRDGTP